MAPFCNLLIITAFTICGSLAFGSVFCAGGLESTEGGGADSPSSMENERVEGTGLNEPVKRLGQALQLALQQEAATTIGVRIGHPFLGVKWYASFSHYNRFSL